MGFGFNLFFIFILLPLVGILTFSYLFTRNKIFVKIIGLIMVVMLVLSFLLGILRAFRSNQELDKEDYHGHYIINRDYFKGEQADWQYNTYRFEIKDNDSIYFHITNKDKIVKTFCGTITTTEQYISERLVINIEKPTYHIIKSNPTTYRSPWNFYLVFYSSKFNNVYFKKGKWEPID